MRWGNSKIYLFTKLYTRYFIVVSILVMDGYSVKHWKIKGDQNFSSTEWSHWEKIESGF